MEIEKSPAKIFYCYARKDEALLKNLLTYTKSLERSGLITQWYDGQITAGEHWREEIAFNLRIADVILLLITPEFIASDHAYEYEMKAAIEAEKKRLVQVIPIIVRPTPGWKENEFFGYLQALPKDGKPVTKWRAPSDAWTNVVEGIKQAIHELPKSRRAERTLTYIQETHDKAHSDPRLLDFLKWRYEKRSILDLLKRGGKTYPVAVYPASDEQMLKPESILSDLKLNIPRYSENSEKSPLIDKEFRNWLMQAKSERVVNKPTFCMKEFKKGENLAFECQIDWYYNMLDTCDSLEWEILSKMGRLKGLDDAAFEKFEEEVLIRRSLFHAKVDDPIREGKLRSVALSVSTLIAYNDEGTLYLWLQRRTSDVATHAGFFHLIPSGIFQPEFLEQTKREYSVKHNVYREYLEEIFQYPLPKTAQEYKWFYGNPKLQYLENLLREGKAEFYLSGVAVSPLNFRPEICTVLLFRSSEWHDHHSYDDPSNSDRFQLNEEWEKNETKAERRRSVIRIPFAKITSNGDLVEPMSDDEIVEYMQKEKFLHLDVDRMVPVGAGSFWLGIDILRRVLKQPRL